MTLLYSDPRFLNHETGNHPERADRIRAIPQRLEASGLDGQCRRVDFAPVSRERLTRVHSPTYIDQVLAMAKWGGGHLDPDTVVCAASYETALLAAGCVCDAAERVVRGEDTTALCLVRPPGHHAVANRAMGFCLFNNVAVAARLAVDELGLDRVLVVDWDVHHGNGTQATFWEDPAVGFLSIHRWPFYPGTGRDSETGGGPGLGTVRNLPVEFGISRKDYLALFSDELEQFAAKINPQLILVSAGFDAHARDPIGGLGLETEDFGVMSDIVLDAADAYAEGRLLSVLEGGYDPSALADCVELHLTKMVQRA
ncbi:MAG TPA: histone deacetylase [Thermoguttaceae bacterium]|nr:histone deacetylase [Thermoguttaceae bacterium]